MNGSVLEIAAFAVCLFCLMGSFGSRYGNERHRSKNWISRLKDQHFIYISLLICLMISAVSDLLDVYI